MEKKALIEALNKFSPLFNGIAEIVVKETECISYDINQIIVEQGKRCNKLFFLASGLIKSSYLDSKGSEIVTSFIQKGEFFTNVSGFSNASLSSESFTVLENSLLYSIEFEKYLRLINNSSILAAINYKIINNHRLELENRIKMLQCLKASDKYRIFLDEYSQIADRIQNRDIASFLGIRMETLSRIKKKKLS